MHSLCVLSTYTAREAGFEIAENPAYADIFVVDGTNDAALEHWRRLDPKHTRPALLVGGAPMEGERLVHLKRPLHASRVLAALQEIAAKDDRPMAPSGMPPALSACMLVVDPDPGVRSEIANFLAPLAVEVLCAPNRITAMMLIRNQPIGLALVSLDLPRIEMLRLTRQLRTHGGPDARLPVFALTRRRKSRLDFLCASLARASGYFDEPISPGALRTLVSQYLGVPAGARL